MTIQPYLNFSGQCEEAFHFYERVLGGKLLGMFTFGSSPMADSVPPEWSSKIMHIGMQLGDQMLLGCDAPPPHFQKPQGFSVCLDLPGEADAERIFPVLSEGGTVSMPLAETFWAKRFAMFTDRFGTPWMINVTKPM